MTNILVPVYTDYIWAPKAFYSFAQSCPEAALSTLIQPHSQAPPPKHLQVPFSGCKVKSRFHWSFCKKYTEGSLFCFPSYPGCFISVSFNSLLQLYNLASPTLFQFTSLLEAPHTTPSIHNTAFPPKLRNVYPLASSGCILTYYLV